MPHDILPIYVFQEDCHNIQGMTYNIIAFPILKFNFDAKRY